ncbi:MAG: hypothetical protein VZR27_05325 [Acutalibacteraceae bacterium]|nr:hypothetical protein [Acutalibacteraceae bacterium]
MIMLYKVTEKTFQFSSTEEYTAYGIQVIDDNTGDVLCTVHDVFLEKEQAEKCVHMFNMGSLDTIHLYEAIENAISDPDFFFNN